MKSPALAFLQVSALALAMGLTPSFAFAADKPPQDAHKQIPKCEPERILYYTMPHLHNNPLTPKMHGTVLHKVALKKGDAPPYELCYDTVA